MVSNQCYRASGLNLLAAAIILWNTVYLAKAVEELRKRQKNPFLRLLNFLAWSVPRRDDHGSIRNGA